MDKNDEGGAANANDPGEAGAASEHAARVPDALSKDISRRQSAVIEDEATVLGREKLATARGSGAGA